MKAYLSLSTLFWLIRQFFIPNPFDAFGEGITVMISGAPVLLTPETLNWIAGGVLPLFTFAIVGRYYVKNSDPVAGSCMYMIFFCVHTGLLHLMALAYPAIWLIVLIFVVYIALHIAVRLRMNEIGY